MKDLRPFEQALLFQYVLEQKGDVGFPDWAGNDPVAIFARLMNKPYNWAKAAYERARRAGYMDKHAPEAK